MSFVLVFLKLGTTPLIVASRYGHEEVVEALLDAGAEIDMTNIVRRGGCYFSVFLIRL